MVLWVFLHLQTAMRGISTQHSPLTMTSLGLLIMNKFKHFFSSCTILIILAFSIATTVTANPIQQPQIGTVPTSNNPPKTVPTVIPPAPDIDAKGFVLMDAKTGTILAQKNMHKKMPPASLTKLMTLYLTSEALQQGQIKLQDKVRISEKAWRRGGSRMFVKEGSRVAVKDLIKGIIVASGNDACVAIAQYIAGTEKTFAQLMNQTAKRLGMADSHFTDSTGLPSPDHYSTPYDLAILTRNIINQFPEYYGWYKDKWITHNGIKQPNRNRLLWRNPFVDGLKTGHTAAAGFCLIASAKNKDMRLISVVMGTPSDNARARSSQALLNWGFRYYKNFKLFNANKILANPRVWFGSNKHVGMGLANELFVTIPKGQYNNLKAILQLPPKLRAPILKNQAYGTVMVTLNGNKIASAPIIALNDDNRGGLWTRFSDHIILFFKGLF